MNTTDEATINPDGSQTFQEQAPPVDDSARQQQPGGEEGAGGDFFNGTNADDTVLKASEGVDPALYLLAVFIIVAVLYYFFVFKRKTTESDDDFFNSLDGEKFNLKLPAEVQEYYDIKEKCEDAGWEPGKPPAGGVDGPNATGPHRVLAQALMKRAIADIPIVQHIQKESTGMNKLYSQSMCSVKQWKSYQAAEQLVSNEVDEVRAEADEIEPGWSQVIWRQAMQYHQMLKQKHEQEAKQLEEAAKKRKEIESKVQTEKKVVDDKKAQEEAAERAAQELLKMEEREKQSKKAFKGSGMKKGFLEKGKKK